MAIGVGLRQFVRLEGRTLPPPVGGIVADDRLCYGKVEGQRLFLLCFTIPHRVGPLLSFLRYYEYMMMPRGTVLALLLGVGFFQALGVTPALDQLGDALGAQLASPFYAETTTPEILQADYAKRSIKVLVVPGHDPVHHGTDYKGVTEAELNAALGTRIANLLAADDRFDAQETRDESGNFAPWFASYMSKEQERIHAYEDERRAQFKDAQREGFITREQIVEHNTAPSVVADQLYAVNKYASENAIDLVLHIHWNDYPGRRSDKVPKYSGFVIYVPDGQLPNARASRAVAQSVKSRLEPYFAVSNMPKESAGIVPDQDLIATGSNASQKKAAMLIEYAYMYEPQYTDPATRDALLDELALQTYWGIVDFFEAGKGVPAKRVGVLLPHSWQSTDFIKTKGRTLDALAAQAALLEEGMYPKQGKTLNDCPLAGTIGSCTKDALKNFAAVLGSSTTMEAAVGALNDRYGTNEQ